MIAKCEVVAKRIFTLAVALFVFSLWAPAAFALPIQTLTDGNSIIHVDPGSQAGVSNWFVNSVNQLDQQWFWYRVGSNPEASLDTIGTPAISNLGNLLELTYNAYDQNNAPWFNVRVIFTLSGGLPGSRSSDLDEGITIDNLSSNPLNFHFFQYTNFDLAGTPGGDTAQEINPNLMKQTDGTLGLSETVITPDPSRVEVALCCSTLAELNSGVAYNLNNTTGAGPGNVTWAWQWDFVIPAGDSQIISKDMRLRVAEPSTLFLLGLGLAFVGVVGRKRFGKTC